MKNELEIALNKTDHKKTRKLEHALQVECVKWFRLQYPKYIIFAIPNGGTRNIIEAVNLKAEGVLKGIPDLFIPFPNKNYHGLFIEMKYGKRGIVSDAQEDMIFKLKELGYWCEVCRNFDRFKDVVNEYMYNVCLK